MRRLKDLWLASAAWTRRAHAGVARLLLKRAGRAEPAQAALVGAALMLLLSLPILYLIATGPLEAGAQSGRATQARRSSEGDPSSEGGHVPGESNLGFVGSWIGVSGPPSGPDVARWMALRPDGSIEILQGGHLAKGTWHLTQPAGGGLRQLRVRYRFFGPHGKPIAAAQERVFSVQLSGGKRSAEASSAAARGGGRPPKGRFPAAAPEGMRLVSSQGRAFLYHRSR